VEGYLSYKYFFGQRSNDHIDKQMLEELINLVQSGPLSVPPSTIVMSNSEHHPTS
jgi:hypothetical protein